MPNWCSTTYKITGNKQQVKKLYKTIVKLDEQEKPKIPNGFGTLWLGELVNVLGGNRANVYCRGEINYYDYNGEVITLQMDTAWCECRDFRHFLEAKFPGIKIYYIAEEPGCEVYCTNDLEAKYFSERFLLDGEDLQYFDTLEDALKEVSKLTGTEVKTTDEIYDALDAYNEQHDDDDYYYSFHEFTVADD